MKFTLVEIKKNEIQISQERIYTYMSRIIIPSMYQQKTEWLILYGYIHICETIFSVWICTLSSFHQFHYYICGSSGGISIGSVHDRPTSVTNLSMSSTLINLISCVDNLELIGSCLLYCFIIQQTKRPQSRLHTNYRYGQF